MGEFSMVQHETWRDSDFLRLGTDAKLVFFWSWTNPHSAISGLYEVSPRIIAREVFGSAAADRVRDALDELAEKPMVKYDQDYELIWVVNRARYNNRNAKTAAAMQREVNPLLRIESPLVDEFIAKYGKALSLVPMTWQR